MLNLSIALKVQGHYLCLTCERVLTTMPRNPDLLLCMFCQLLFASKKKEVKSDAAS